MILVLLILGISQDAIDHDYRLSDAALLPEKELRLAEIREVGLTDDFGVTSKELVARTIEHLDVRYGGVEGYLNGIGFGQSERENLKELLSS